MEKRLAKIQSVSFGLGGYQGAMIGIHFTLGNDSWGVGAQMAEWDAENVKHTENTNWTEEGRNVKYAEIMRYVSKLLKQAKVDTVDKLKGIPVEVTFDGQTLKEWRILEEVL